MNTVVERLKPDMNSKNPDYLIHRARYVFASKIKNKVKVLDIACGYGYGSRILSKKGLRKVIGVDISEQAVNFAKSKPKIANLDYICSDIFELKMQKNYFDLIVSFETIEHTERQKEFIEKMKSYLKTEGVLIISTPNTKALLPGMEKYSPFHKKEISKEELNDLLQAGFKEINFFYQKYPTAWARLVNKMSFHGYNYLPQKINNRLFRIINKSLFSPARIICKIMDFFYSEKNAFPKEYLEKFDHEACVIIAVAKKI